ncbi:hypothetical protein MMC07_002717 [Pseudocyphellaria aurata]|nr:hypothetical protein [Pseudocyphellaria aurata]
MVSLGQLLWIIAASLTSFNVATVLVITQGCAIFNDQPACSSDDRNDRTLVVLGSKQDCPTGKLDCSLRLVVLAGFPIHGPRQALPTCKLDIAYSTAYTYILFEKDPDSQKVCLFYLQGNSKHIHITDGDKENSCCDNDHPYGSKKELPNPYPPSTLDSPLEIPIDIPTLGAELNGDQLLISEGSDYEWLENIIGTESSDLLQGLVAVQPSKPDYVAITPDASPDGWPPMFADLA